MDVFYISTVQACKLGHLYGHIIVIKYYGS